MLFRKQGAASTWTVAFGLRSPPSELATVWSWLLPQGDTVYGKKPAQEGRAQRRCGRKVDALRLELLLSALSCDV